MIRNPSHCVACRGRNRGYIAVHHVDDLTGEPDCWQCFRCGALMAWQNGLRKGPQGAMLPGWKCIGYRDVVLPNGINGIKAIR